MATIRALPEEAAAQVKASVLITSLRDVILGLLENSLDSNASRIEIEVDFEKGFCAIEDDGAGIAPSEFSEDGGLVKVHRKRSIAAPLRVLTRVDTSKSKKSLYLHGRSGLFLWAVSSLATLTIVSMQEPWQAAASMTLHHGQAVHRELSVEISPLRHLRHGTRVEVRNLFGNMPVRTKQRPKISDGSSYRAWRRTVKDLTGTMLAWGKRVDISLKAINGSHKMRVSNSDHQISSASIETWSASSTARFQLPILKNILLNGTSIDPQSLDQWISTSARTQRWTIRAFLSRQPWPSREVQFICFGVHYIKEADSLSGLYDEVNNIFESSSFADFDNFAPTSSLVHDDRQNYRGGHSGKESRNKGKRVERWPMFFLRIDDNVGSSYHPSDSTKATDNEASISPVLKVLIESFLAQNNIRLGSAKARCESSPVPSTCRDENFDTQVNALSLCEHDMSHSLKSSTRASTPIVHTWSIMKQGRRALSSLQMKGSHDPDNHTTSLESSDTTDSQQSAESKFFSPNPARSTTVKLSRTVSEMTAAATRTSWASELLKRWENPVYNTTEQGVPQFPDPELTNADGLYSERLLELQFSASPSNETMRVESKISRSDLFRAEMISQVDGKFILIKIKPHDAPHSKELGHDGSVIENLKQELLILIDQHAADERVKVEALLADLCQPAPTQLQDFRSPLGYVSAINTEVLSTVIGFDLNEQECALFRRYAERYAGWGVLYTVNHDRGESCTSDEHSLFVLSLPPLISERCRAEPKLLSDLLRRDVWSIHSATSLDRSAKGTTKTELEAASFWSQLHSCPEGILDLVNSRACRSAIMFNDRLTILECQELIQRLARCRLPFQCAHGRPSMVPVANLEVTSLGWSVGTSTQTSSMRTVQNKSFLSAWHDWNMLEQ